MSAFPITCRAYYADGSPIPGNEDDFHSIEAMHAHYSGLLNAVAEGKFSRVAFWRFETADGRVKLRLER
jgi:hypothetical protein